VKFCNKNLNNLLITLFKKKLLNLNLKSDINFHFDKKNDN